MQPMPVDLLKSVRLDAVSRYEALLTVSRAIACHRSVADLLRAIANYVQERDR